MFKENHLCGGIHLRMLSTLKRRGLNGGSLKYISSRNSFQSNVMTRICNISLSSILEA
jgi:hypothetical protein